MSARDVRRALLRAVLLACLGAALLHVACALNDRAPTPGMLAAALAGSAATLPLTWIEVAARRRAEAGRPYEVFLPTWCLSVGVALGLAAVDAYVDALRAGADLAASLARALEALARTGERPALLLGVLAWSMLPVACVASMRVRGRDAYGAGALIVAVLGLPFLCLEPFVFAAFFLVAPALLGLYALADRLERRWRRWRDREAIAALRATLDERTVAQARVLAHLGDEVACGALGYPDPDEGAPDPEAWAKGLLSIGPRLVGRAALAAAEVALEALDGADRAAAEEALAACREALASPPDAPAAAERARRSVEPWTRADVEAARRAVIEAVHAVADGRRWCGVDAVRAAIAATGDVARVRAAIREAVEPHLDELAPTASGASS